MPYNLSLDLLELAMPTVSFVHEDTRVTRPISDHLPMVQNTLWGAVATFNILHPGSPIAPPLQLNNVRSLPKDGTQQMNALAEYIFNMFLHGVGILALQEVPNPNTANFKSLVARLIELVEDSDLIDVNALKKQWLQTGTHSFGTSILYNPHRFTITHNASHALSSRAAEYRLMDKLSSMKIPIANIHGHFEAQKSTQDYLDNFEGIILGDTNIEQLTAPKQDDILQSEVKPLVLIEGKGCQLNTFDVIQDGYSRRFQPDFVPDTSRLMAAEICVEPESLAESLEDPDEERIEPDEIVIPDQKRILFNAKLDELLAQVKDLERRRNKEKEGSKQYVNLNEAYQCAHGLHGILKESGNKYFDNTIDYATFRKCSDEAIKDAASVLGTHRGAKKILEVVLNIALIVASLARSAWNGKMTFFRLNTQSINVVNEVEESINKAAPLA